MLNNSLILAEDSSGNEVIAMGKGIGFKNKAGDILDKSVIEKVYAPRDNSSKNDYLRLIEETPVEHIEITNNIIKIANEKLNGELSDQIFITLVDHISYALVRYEKGIVLQNRLTWEVKKFYPKEFKIALEAVDYINKTLNISLPEEEAANIAFHFVNAQTNEQQMQDTILSVKMQKDIFNIVQYNLGIKLDKDSINYSRFVTHVQFFIQRLLEGKMIESKDRFIFDQITREYEKEVKCANLIGDYVKNLLDKEISYEELLYLTIHIVRISQR